MHRCLKTACLFLVVIFVSSCTTAEYQQARSGCAQIAYNNIPIVLEEFQCQKNIVTLRFLQARQNV